MIILAAIAALGAGGYYMLKPVSDVAQVTHSAVVSAKDGASSLVSAEFDFTPRSWVHDAKIGEMY